MRIAEEDCDDITIPERTITAENCDNIIIPEANFDEVITFPTEQKPSPSVSDSPDRASSKKMPISKLKSFFRSKISRKENLDDFFEKSTPPQSQSSDLDGTDEDFSLDEGIPYVSKFQRRIPPKMNAVRFSQDVRSR